MNDRNIRRAIELVYENKNKRDSDEKVKQELLILIMLQEIGNTNDSSDLLIMLDHIDLVDLFDMAAIPMTMGTAALKKGVKEILEQDIHYKKTQLKYMSQLQRSC